MRKLVEDRYAPSGRPSVDPVVFFKLQLVLFFERLRSERQLMKVVADRLSIRWYLGYDLHELLPDHSSLTRIRDRYGLEVFRRFFEAIVERCAEAGLVWGEELYFDATKVEANASIDSTRSRSLVGDRLEEHLAGVFSPRTPRPPTTTSTPRPPPASWDPRVTRGERSRKPTRSGTAGSPGPGARSGGLSGGATGGWRT